MLAMDSELIAIDAILRELQKIPKDRREAAVTYVVEKLKIRGVPYGSDEASETLAGQAKGDYVIQKGETIKDFADRKKPKNNYQLIACLGYFLEKQKGLGEFGANEIKLANGTARRPDISNLARDLRDTKDKYRFIRNSGKDKRKKILTSVGEKVVAALPDQEKVKSITKASKPRKRRKRSKAK